MYIQLLLVDLQLNNSHTFLRKQLVVNIAVTLHNAVPGNYVPYVYVTNLQDDKHFILCAHLSQSSFIDSVDSCLEDYTSLIWGGQRLFIHAENLNLFLVFIVPL